MRYVFLMLLGFAWAYASDIVKDTQVQVGGRVQVDMDFASPQGSFTPGGIVLDSKGENAQLSFNVRDSRLWFKSQSDTELGLIRTVTEIYYFGEKGSEINTNDHGLSLRYLYAAIGDVVVGQANSLFSTRYASDTLNKPMNLTLARQPMLAYTYVLSDQWYLDGSMEQSESYLNDENATAQSINDDIVPDLALRLRGYFERFEFSATAMTRLIRYDGVSIGDVDYEGSDEVWGFGLNVSARLNLYALDHLIVNAQYGNGIGRYFTLNAYTDGTINSDGKIILHDLYGGSVGYQHWWSEHLQSNIVYVTTRFDVPEVLHVQAVEREATSWQANLIYSPIKKGRVGIEYGYAQRLLESGDEGDMHLVRMQLRYDF